MEMEFTEEAAKEIAERHKVPAATVKTWKNRGKIPDRYAAETLPGAAEGANDKQALQDIIRLFKTQKLNLTGLADLAGISRNRITDIMRDKAAVTTQDIINLRSAINKIRSDAKRVLGTVEKRQLSDADKNLVRAFFLREEVALFVLLNRRREVYSYSERFSRDAADFPALYQHEIVAALVLFITESTIT